MSFPSFATGEVLTAADMNAVGLWKTAAVTFSGSSGVEVQNCFSSNYTNYKVLINYFGSVGTNSQIQYMTGTNTRDTVSTYDRWGFYYLNGLTNFTAASQPNQFVANHGTASSSPSTAELTIFKPNVTGEITVSSNHSWAADSGLATWLDFNKRASGGYTGIYFFPASGTITGTITVYGYNK